MDLNVLFLGASSIDIQKVASVLKNEEMSTDPIKLKRIQSERVNVPQLENKPVRFVLSPGFVDSGPDSYSLHDVEKMVRRECSRQKFDMLAVVTSYPVRWTDEDRRSAQATKNIIDLAQLHGKAVLIFTNGYNFKGKYPENTLKCFQEYLARQASAEARFKEFAGIFRGVFLFDTECDDEDLNGPQMPQFFEGLRKRNDLPTYPFSAQSGGMAHVQTSQFSAQSGEMRHAQTSQRPTDRFRDNPLLKWCTLL